MAKDVKEIKSYLENRLAEVRNLEEKARSEKNDALVVEYYACGCEIIRTLNFLEK